MGLVSFSQGYYKSFHHQHYVMSGIFGGKEEGSVSETSHAGLPEHRRNDLKVVDMVALEDKPCGGNLAHLSALDGQGNC